MDVFDVAKHDFTRIECLKTVEREAHGNKRLVGPSSGAVGQGFAYVGNRATQEVCAVDLQTLKSGSCFRSSRRCRTVSNTSPPCTRFWVTTPSNQSVMVLEALPKKGHLKEKAAIKLEG